MEDYFTRGQTPDDKTFVKFQELGEDLMMHVLSFVAGAPFEEKGQPSQQGGPTTRGQQRTRTTNNVVDHYMSAMTHSLPLVSKQFHRLMKHESLWKAAFIRQVQREPMLWYKGLLDVNPTAAGAAAAPTTSQQQQQQEEDDEEEAEEEGKEEEEGVEAGSSSSSPAATTPKQQQHRQQLPWENTTQLLTQIPPEGQSSLDLYRQVLNTSIRQIKPIFAMRQPLKLGEPYGLHFFEPRYRILIADVLRDFPPEAKRGEPIVCAPGQSPPTFLHAHVHPLARGRPACIVQVIRCRIYPDDGRADVFLLPIQHVYMELMWERPNSGHLYYGQCLKAGKEESELLDRASAEPHVFGFY